MPLRVLCSWLLLLVKACVVAIVPNLECSKFVPERLLVDASEWRSSDSTRKPGPSSDAELLHGTALQGYRLVCPCLQ